MKGMRGVLLTLALCCALTRPALAYPAVREVPISSAPVGQTLGGFTVFSSGGARITYDRGVLTVSGGQAEISGGQAGERIVAEGKGTLTLSGVSIQAKNGAGITLSPGAQTTIFLSAGTENTVSGSDNCAGVQVTWAGDNSAALTLTGRGSLTARGGRNAAGIGGSYYAGAFYGDITVNSGRIHAAGGSNAAGIGSAVNAQGSQKSFKMDTQSWGVITINGGTVIAEGIGSGAGIGGGNHADSGVIRITGGTVTASGASGIGSGVGSADQDRSGGKGPGYYYGKVEIQGGTVSARGGENGAGIGGAMYCDGVVVITGGTVNAQGGGGLLSRHGGAGIGGGFEGHGQVTVAGGVVTAQGGSGAGGIGSGGGANANGDRGRSSRGLAAQLKGTEITVSEGQVTAEGGSAGGAGIGGGVGADSVKVTVTGGTVGALGAPGTRLVPQGGAAIGSGYSGLFTGTASPYASQAAVSVSVTGGRVRAVGGWGAAAIGGGANNRSAELVEIGSGADITALSDGARFALDSKPNEDGSSPGQRLAAGVFQGTFTDLATVWHRIDYEGLTVFLTREGGTETLTLPEGYRSFARSVPAGEYTLAAGKEHFAASGPETEIPDRLDRGHRFTVPEGGWADVCYLSPMVTVTAEVVWDDEENADQSRGDAVLNLFQDGAAREGESVVIPAAGEERTARWTDLPRYTADGVTPRDYSVLAGDLPGYTWTTEAREEELTLTASHTPDRFELSGEVIWLNVEADKRPESLTLTLWADGVRLGTAEAAPGKTGLWTYDYGPVLRTLAGREIRYTAAAEGRTGWLVIPSGRNLLVMPWP